MNNGTLMQQHHALLQQVVDTFSAEAEGNGEPQSRPFKGAFQEYRDFVLARRVTLEAVRASLTESPLGGLVRSKEFETFLALDIPFLKTHFQRRRGQSNLYFGVGAGFAALAGLMVIAHFMMGEISNTTIVVNGVIAVGGVVQGKKIRDSLLQRESRLEQSMCALLYAWQDQQQI